LLLQIPSHSAGRTLFEAILAKDGTPTPVGLIAAAVGGSPIEFWIPQIDAANYSKNPCEIDSPACDNSGEVVDSEFFGEYIKRLLPYTIGAVIWDQVGNPNP